MVKPLKFWKASGWSGGGSSGGGTTNFMANPSAHGWPDASNTGPRIASNLLVRVPEDVQSGPGWVYDPDFQRVQIWPNPATLSGYKFSCQLYIDAPNCLIEDCEFEYHYPNGDAIGVILIRGNWVANGYEAANTVIRYCKVGSSLADQSQRAAVAIRDLFGAPGTLVEYCNLYGTGSMVNLEGVNCTARYNYCHENGHFLDDHHSGISTHGGGNNILIHHNTVDLSDAHFIAGGGGISGCITIYSDFVSARNVTISENLVAGGGYCMYGGNSGTFAPTSGGIMIQNNRISNLHWPNGGQFGWLASWDAAGIGNAISGNVWDADGAAIP